ncbi:hypothetical protein SRHO_G00340500 [Serrasalmus rhombeus]
MRLYLKCVEDIRREIATLPLQITDFYMFLLIEFLGTKTVALVPKSWGKHDVRILKSCNKLFQRFQLEVIQLQYPGSPLLQGCTNLSGRGRGQEQRVFPALQGMCYPRLKEDAGGRIHGKLTVGPFSFVLCARRLTGPFQFLSGDHA